MLKVPYRKWKCDNKTLKRGMTIWRRWSRDKVLMIMMLFSHVFYLCCKDSSSLYAIHSSILEPYGICILKKEYSQSVNMKMMLLNVVLFIHYVFHHCDQWSLCIVGCIIKCCKVTNKHLTMFLYLCLIRPLSHGGWTTIHQVYQISNYWTLLDFQKS